MRSLGVYWVATVCLLAICLYLTDGRLIYTLDDPYIHLAVAENILRGGYGINIQELSSPSSSILWPFLVAAALFIGLGDWGPLVINVVATSLSVWILSGLLWRLCIRSPAIATFKSMALVLLPFLLLSINAVALPFTGMEHPLHILASVLVVTGLIELSQDGRVRPYMLAGIVAAPLMRFEGVALSLFALGMLVWQGKRRASAAAGVVLLSVLVGWVAMALSLGLPALPSSALAKSRVSTAALDANVLGVLRGVLDNVWLSAHNYTGLLFLVSIVLLGVSLWSVDKEKRRNAVVVALPVICTLVAHVLAGGYGWFGRYEVYAGATLLVALLFTLRAWPSGMLSPNVSLFMIGAPLILLSMSYLRNTTDTPIASRNIYQQQYQMHRFATEFFPSNVAVNDLGYVAYNNDKFVLDLWGLGSEEVRRIRKDYSTTKAGFAALVRKHSVEFAMIYDDWFVAAIPDEWCRTATLTTSRVTAARGQVAFYSTNADTKSRMDAALRAFGDTLPMGASIEFHDCAVKFSNR
jgi:hypothetical protein